MAQNISQCSFTEPTDIKQNRLIKFLCKSHNNILICEIIILAPVKWAQFIIRAECLLDALITARQTLGASGGHPQICRSLPTVPGPNHD